MPRSRFTKMRIILQETSNSPDISLNDLITRIVDSKLDAFKVFRRSGNTVIVDYCKPSTIMKTIRLIEDLGLVVINDNCHLTEDGNRAISDYEGTLEQAIVEYLHEPHGIEFTKIKEAIQSIKQRSTGDVPSADEIHEYLKSSGAFKKYIEPDRFRTLLNILGRTGLLLPGFRKFYWAE
jgi:hypothetical protein